MTNVAAQPLLRGVADDARTYNLKTASTLGSAEPLESALMRSCPKSPDCLLEADSDEDEWADMAETDDSDDNGIFISVDFAEGNICGADEIIDMTVALDSGAVDHVLNTHHLPSSAEINDLTGSRIGKCFVAANGQPMQTFGECTLECLDEKGGLSAASFAVTEVSRPLQSVSRICDQDLEVLFTKTEAKVRDPKTGKWIASYPRRGGLYTRNVRVRAGQKPKQAPTGGRPKAPFPRRSP